MNKRACYDGRADDESAGAEASWKACQVEVKGQRHDDGKMRGGVVSTIGQNPHPGIIVLKGRHGALGDRRLNI